MIVIKTNTGPKVKTENKYSYPNTATFQVSSTQQKFNSG